VAELRWDIPSAAAARELIRSPLPFRLRFGTPHGTFYRDLYFDSGDLRRRGATCRLRYDVRDRCRLAIVVPGMERCEAAVSELDPKAVFAGAAEPARRLRALVDPARLGVRLELEVERHLRRACLPVGRVPQFVLALDSITARRHGSSLTFHELVAWRVRGGIIPLAWLGRRLARQHPSLTASGERLDRAEALLAAAAQEARTSSPPRRIAVIAVAHGRMALCREGAALILPQEDGAGEDACRRAMRRRLGSAEGEIRLLAVAPAIDTGPQLEVWLARRLRNDLTTAPPAGLEWHAPADLTARVGSPVLRDPLTLAALAIAGRSDLLPEWSGTPREPPPPDGSGRRLTLSELRVPLEPPPAHAAVVPDRDRFINVHLSAIEFNARVLALAEDDRSPLAARLRFLAIVSTNVDQLFMIGVAALQQQVAAGMTDPAPDGLTPAEQLDAIAIRLRPLRARQYQVFADLARGPLAQVGMTLRDWPGLRPEEQAALERRWTDEIAPLLTPKTLTRAPGHPFPQIADRRLSLAVLLRDQANGPLHFAAVELPAALPRFLPLEAGGVVPLEALIRPRLQALFPGRTIVAAHTFRLTRGGDILLDELGTASFIQAIGEELRRRSWGPVVRLEVERAMPPPLRELLQRELRFEESARQSALGPSDVYEANGPVDLGSLGELAAMVGPELDYPPFLPSDPFAEERSVCGALDRGDVLVHHPYDSFATTFERFIAEAADDPDCVAIKLTL
jgi:Polyphosphate kinase middle domain/Polyphosphate kinase N-terminal domain/Polyphosphate kinase C-terminal domain 1